MLGFDRKSSAHAQIDAIDLNETWLEEPTRQHSVVILDNMYFLDLAANRRVEGTDRGVMGDGVRLPDIDYVGGEF